VFREELTRRKYLNPCETEILKDDVMSGLMQMADEQGNKLSDDEVVDNIVTLVVVAYDTTANAATRAAYYLAS
jgi:ent-kaurenoic acid hydroxylase